jgi:GT2 family glycosyltransferase
MVTWNSASVLPAALAGLSGADPLPAELVLVDNASSDDSVAILEAAAGRAPYSVRLIQSPSNVGFAKGMNLALKAASSDIVLLLNPDVRVSETMIGVLHLALASAPEDVYAVGPKLLRAAGNELGSTSTIDTTGIVMTRDGRHLDRGAGKADTGQYDGQEEVFGFSGAAVAFRKSFLVAGSIDGEIFDGDFFAYREDADLAWRMRGFGYRALYQPAAVGYHLRHVTPERRRSLPPAINMHSVKNRFLLRIHHADAWWLLRFGPISLLRDLVVIGACLTVERSSLPALTWVVRNARRHLRRRREILSRRQVSSAELREWFR